ncbi:MAG: hypothetical protein OEZ03_16935 [Alphaproteobacteria bacterium]|nr:hypothetical protein [Alphaproteobacteria bacterium]
MNIEMNPRIRAVATTSVISMALFLAACSGNASASQAAACKSGLSQAYAEFEQAKAEGFDGAVAMTKAGSLLSAAKIQQQFEKYPNCIDKVKRARKYIRQARNGG